MKKKPARTSDATPRVEIIVTAGPSFEPIDQVRRLTNFSTGQLGGELAQFLVRHGNGVRLFRSRIAVFRPPTIGEVVSEFGTSDELSHLLEHAPGRDKIGAVFHAAALADFQVARISENREANEWAPAATGKLSSLNPIWLELRPAPKILPRLRGWFPAAAVVGWKYEVDGGRASALAKAKRQLEQGVTDASVANGPAYGSGFGIVQPGDRFIHAASREDLFRALLEIARRSGV